MVIRESIIQKRILEYLNGLPGCKAYNMHGNGYQGAGRPDIIACCRGQFLALEVKTDNGQPTRLQLHELEKWREAGAVASVVHSVEEVKTLIGGLAHGELEKLAP